MLNQAEEAENSTAEIFFTRDLLSKLSNRQYLMINLLEAPLLATILGFILRYTRPDASIPLQTIRIFRLIYLFVWLSPYSFGLSVSAGEIIRDRKKFYKGKISES